MIYTDADTYITSDLHFFHSNIIRYCDRPYTLNGKLITDNRSELDRMAEDILKKFDELPSYSCVWLLGDIFFCGSREIKTFAELYKEDFRRIVSRMKENNKRVYLVIGNHDILRTKDMNRMDFYYWMGFDKVYDTPVIINDNMILSHEPTYIPLEDKVYHNYYGHTHDLCIEEDYFTYGYDNYPMIKKCCKKDNVDMPPIEQKYPNKMVDISKYHNVCYDYTGGLIKLEQPSIDGYSSRIERQFDLERKNI